MTYGELRKRIPESAVTMSTTAGGRIKVENKELPSGAFVWEFHLTPGEARKFGEMLARLADELSEPDAT